MTGDPVAGERAPRQARKRTTPLVNGLLIALALAVGFVLFTWFAAGPLKSAQIDQNLNRTYPIDAYRGWLVALDRIGQRAVCLPILAIVVAWVAARHRSARPVLVALVGVLSVNIVVWILKLWLGRGQPEAGRPGFFIEGQAYPSGHAANIVMVYGLCVYLIAHYTLVSTRVRRILAGGVLCLMVLMTVVSVLLRWHWFTDLIGGYLVAGVLLSAITAVDAAVPFASRRLEVLAPENLAPVTAPDAAPEAAGRDEPGSGSGSRPDHVPSPATTPHQTATLDPS